MKNYYAILEVPVGSSPEEIRQAYRRLASENLDNAEAFAQLKEAHEALTSPARRAEYDQQAWGETFAPGGETPKLAVPTAPERLGRCPMGAEEHCPVLQLRVAPADNFCPECGFLLNVTGSGSYDLSEEVEAPSVQLEEVGGRIHVLHPGSNLVGREVADVLLPDKTVSRQHARLEVIENGEITLEDLSSTNGTLVNDQSLVPHLPRQLAGGDRIRFGSVLTTLSVPQTEEASAMADEPETPEEERLEQAAPPAQARLTEMREAASDEDAPREFLLEPGVTTFGRRAENTIVLQGDPYVSGSHAQIIAEGDTFRLVDVGSTNGTLINGERLAHHDPVVLSSGDLIVIGGTALRFEPVSAEKMEDEAEKPEEILGVKTEEEKVEEVTEEVPTAPPSQNEPAPAAPVEG